MLYKCVSVFASFTKLDPEPDEEDVDYILGSGVDFDS